MAPPGYLPAMMIGSYAKVFLPGESPWAECVAIYEDGTWDGRIDNRLFAELSEHEQARFMKRIFRSVAPLPRLHDYHQNQIVRFKRELTPDYEIWVPYDKLPPDLPMRGPVGLKHFPK